MVDNIKFEKITPLDKDSVYNLTKDTWEWGDYIPRVFDLWINDGLFIKGVDENNNLLGIIHVKLFDDFAWLEGIRVNKELRRKGIGKKLTEKAIELSKKKVIRLIVNEKNYPSLALVSSMGFKEIDRIYLNEGDRIEFRKIVEKYKLKEIKNIHVDIKGFIDEWVWFPIEKYNKSFYINDNMILMETNPPFLYKGESVEFEHTSKVKKENSEGFIVFELNI